MSPHDGTLCTVKLSTDLWWEIFSKIANSTGPSPTLIWNGFDQIISFLSHVSVSLGIRVAFGWYE